MAVACRRCGGLVLLAGAAVDRAGRRGDADERGQAVRFEVGESEKMKFFYGGAMAVSPDGHWMVFPATGEDGVNRYWLRSLDTVEARPLPAPKRRTCRRRGRPTAATCCSRAQQS